MPIKVLICDDEKMVCELIMRLIDWNSLDMSIVGIVHNGFEALELIKEMQPDIVITDIKMPEMDGLELVRNAAEKGYSNKFIIISGHKQFDYAYNAIKYGVEDYLLKPINERELINVLKRLRDNITTNKYTEKQNTPLRDQFVWSLFKDLPMPNYDMAKLNRLYGFNFAKGYFQLIALQQDQTDMTVEQEADKRFVIQKKITEMLNDTMTKYCCDHEVIHEENLSLCLINFKQENHERMPRILKRLFSDIKLYISSVSDNLKITLAYSRVISDMKELKLVNADIHNAVKSRIILGIGSIIDASKSLGMAPKMQNAITSEYWQRFDHIIDVLDIENMKNWMVSIYEHLIALSAEYPSIFMDTAVYIKDMFFVMMERNNNPSDTVSTAKKRAENIIHKAPSTQYLWDELCSVFIYYMNECLKGRQNTENKPIRLIQQYIQNHIHENISLENMANYVHHNPVYLSSLFKKVVGVNFIEYLTECRIAKAKALLKDTGMSISKVSSEVGYNDTRYFSKQFKKKTGITPQKYQNLYS